ncbi:hypothetical protein SDC9_132325 [bioreactor metagenome]|uniref:Uncharacterized protein n=1 Tax=bioreactor metagenome TaxID=1076179 RepID=A0A645D7S9_9ZZZZ|nr:fimbrillin family protein [Rikenellaceae bacterium]
MRSIVTAMFFLISLPIISCIEDDECKCSVNNSKTMTSVTFKGVIDPDTAVKSSMTIPSGIRAIILAYESGDNPVNKSCYPATPLTVISDQNGNLLIENEPSLFMPVGNYDFYAISSNSHYYEEFEIKNGKLRGLKNGKDYLWATKKEMLVNNSTKVTFEFAHKAVAIVINFFAGHGVDSLLITNVSVSKSLEDGELALSSGLITPSTTLSKQTAMVEVYENSCRWIMLPLSGPSEMPVIIDAIVIKGNIKETRRYESSLPIEKGIFKEGTMYNYIISVDAESLSLGKAIITEWKSICMDNILVIE